MSPKENIASMIREWQMSKIYTKLYLQNISNLIDTTFSPFKRINKKPIVPTDEEKALNTRSRSAKLRIGEKL